MSAVVTFEQFNAVFCQEVKLGFIHAAVAAFPILTGMTKSQVLGLFGPYKILGCACAGTPRAIYSVLTDDQRRHVLDNIKAFKDIEVTFKNSVAMMEMTPLPDVLVQWKFQESRRYVYAYLVGLVAEEHNTYGERMDVQCLLSFLYMEEYIVGGPHNAPRSFLAAAVDWAKSYDPVQGAPFLERSQVFCQTLLALLTGHLLIRPCPLPDGTPFEGRFTDTMDYNFPQTLFEKATDGNPLGKFLLAHFENEASVIDQLPLLGLRVDRKRARVDEEEQEEKKKFAKLDDE